MVRIPPILSLLAQPVSALEDATILAVAYWTWGLQACKYEQLKLDPKGE